MMCWTSWVTLQWGHRSVKDFFSSVAPVATVFGAVGICP